MISDDRPKYLNLWKIRLPIPGLVSFLHRTSGALLFLTIPLLFYALEQSLASSRQFETVLLCLKHPAIKVFFLTLVWAFLHHALAGIRFLLLDAGIGTAPRAARATAIGVLLLSLAGVLWVGERIW